MPDKTPFPFDELRAGLFVTLHGKPYRVTHVPAVYKDRALVHLAGEAWGVEDVRWQLRIVLAHLSLTPGKAQPPRLEAAATEGTAQVPPRVPASVLDAVQQHAADLDRQLAAGKPAEGLREEAQQARSFCAALVQLLEQVERMAPGSAAAQERVQQQFLDQIVARPANDKHRAMAAACLAKEWSALGW